MRHFMGATILDHPERFKKRWRLNLIDGAASEIGKDVCFQAADCVRPMLFAPALAHPLNKIERHNLKGILRLLIPPLLRCFLFSPWITPLLQRRACLIFVSSRLFQRNLWIAAERAIFPSRQNGISTATA